MLHIELPLLETIHLGGRVFEGDVHNHEENPSSFSNLFVYRNTLTMSSMRMIK